MRLKHSSIKYLMFVQLAFLQGLKNKKNLIGLSLFLITCLIIFAHLWKMTGSRIMQFDPAQLMWYLVFNEWILVSLPEIHNDIEQDLRAGLLIYLLPRPISYLIAKWFEGIGTLLINLIVLGPISFVFTWIVTGALPFSWAGFLVSIVLGIFAGIVATTFQLLIGVTAFWLHEVGPFNWVWEKLLFVFGGLIFPLSIYPQWMQTIASLTPFPAILGGRSTLAVHFSYHQALIVSLNLLIWAILAGAFSVILYYRGLTVLNKTGG